ncbi:MAG: DUF6502 family protein [Deltaproteobacteria bacterium]|nr:DUF6502 family protein [Deltaproteobacteria bacterium]
MAEITGEKTSTRGGRASLLAAIERIFLPLARLLIARSVPFPLAAGLLRSAYVDVATREFPVEGKRQSDSRVTLLTGVHRKDVKRLRGQRHAPTAAPRAASLGSQLIGRWTALSEYRDAQGAPRPLPRLAGAGEAHSFESLVRSVNTDIRPRVVLDEWLRQGIAHLDEQDRVCLNVDAFIPPDGSDEMAYFFGRNLHDHLAAAVHNVLGEPAPFPERSVNYNRLSPASVAELSELARRRGMEVLQELNARALALQQRDTGQAEARLRFNFGLYLFNEAPPIEPGDQDEDAPD